MKNRTKKQYILAIYLSLVLACLIAFEPLRRNDFISYDDAMYVTDNPSVNQGFTLQSIRWAFTTTHASNWHPLTWLSHMLDCRLFGLNPFFHHLINLLLHIANTLLLFWVLKKMTAALWQSAFVAALFALHPLHVESVAWVAERKDVLSSLLWMLTTIAYIRYTERPGPYRYSLIILLFALGLMAKPMLVTLPFILLLLDYWPIDRFQKSKAHRLLLEKLPLFALTAASSTVTYLVQKTTGATEMVANLPLSYRVNNALVSYVSYIAKMFYPARLAVLYPHKAVSLPLWQPIISILLLITVTAAIIYLAGRRQRYLVTGWFWYLGTLIPVIGLVQVGKQALADRYTYLPSIGLFIILAWSVPKLLAKFPYRKVVLSTTALAALTALLICTRIQLSHWRNTFTLCNRALAVTEQNSVMHYTLANALRTAGSIDEAITHYQKALQLEPNHSRTHGNLGFSLLLKDKLQQAVKHLQHAVQIDPAYINARYNLALTLSKLGSLDEAISHYHRVLQTDPDYPAALNGIAWILCTHPDQNKRNPNRAVELAKSAAQLTEYKNPDILDTLAKSYAEAGKFDMAVTTAELALKLASQQQNYELLTHIRSQLELYKHQKK
jgi:Flp pilus assembly protein TadD